MSNNLKKAVILFCLLSLCSCNNTNTANSVSSTDSSQITAATTVAVTTADTRVTAMVTEASTTETAAVSDSSTDSQLVIHYVDDEDVEVTFDEPQSGVVTTLATLDPYSVKAFLSYLTDITFHQMPCLVLPIKGYVNDGGGDFFDVIAPDGTKCYTTVLDKDGNFSALPYMEEHRDDNVVRYLIFEDKGAGKYTVQIHFFRYSPNKAIVTVSEEVSKVK